MTPSHRPSASNAGIITNPVHSDMLLGRWDFTGGGKLQITVSPEVDTEEALDMAATLIELRRKELARKKGSGSAECTGIRKTVVEGDPDEKHIKRPVGFQP